MPRPISIERLVEHCDPVASPPWEGCAGALDAALVFECLEAGELLDEVVDAGPASPRQHAARIAWFMANLDLTPIEIDVGVNAPPGWLVQDGNHRLYAAILKGDDEIMATILGSCERSMDMLGTYPDDDTPEENILPGRDGRFFELITDDRTVWINADDGMSVGRFSKRGVDVHADAETQMETGIQCLACVHDLPPAEAWEVFRAALLEHYGIEVPEAVRPPFAREEALPSPE